MTTQPPVGQDDSTAGAKTELGIRGPTPIKQNAFNKWKERVGSSFINPLYVVLGGTLAAFVFVILLTFSTPISTSLYFLHTTQANGVRFGVWGWCMDEWKTCSALRLGYTWEPEIPIPITNSFVLYPASLILVVLTLISLIPVLGARDATADRVFRFFGWCSFGTSALGFAFTIGTWVIAKKRFEKAGFEAHFGPLLWVSLVTMLVLLGTVLGSYYFFPPPPVRKANRLSTKTSLATLRDVIKRFSRIGQRQDIENQLAALTKEKERSGVPLPEKTPVANAKVVFDEKKEQEAKRREMHRKRQEKGVSNETVKPPVSRRPKDPGSGGANGGQGGEGTPNSGKTLTVPERRSLRPSQPDVNTRRVSQDTPFPPPPSILIRGRSTDATEPRTPIQVSHNRDRRPVKPNNTHTKSPESATGLSEQSEDMYSPPRVVMAVKAVNTTAQMKHLSGGGGSSSKRRPKSEDRASVNGASSDQRRNRRSSSSRRASKGGR